MPRLDTRFTVAPYDYALAERLAADLGISHVLAQVLVRRDLATAGAARAFLAAEERHPLSAFAGLQAAAERIHAHIERGSRITVHGDYDVDGVASTAVLVRALRTLNADVDWYLPSRIDDGYGLALATVERLAARGTDLLITVDCAITAVEEVAAARAAGLDVVVTDHHTPRADGVLPDAPIVHPRIGGNPCPELCATGVAYKLAQALLGDRAELVEEDLDLVALATVADVVPLEDENRALVRAGLRALARTRKPGLRALMEIARVDPGTVDASAIGFRLAPRINAAGRLHRADAGLELLLTEDPARAKAIAAELDAVNAERRDVETRILFAAEAQVAEQGPVPAYVLTGEDWHPGVIGIVASRIAERHHRPAVLIALDGARAPARAARSRRSTCSAASPRRPSSRPLRRPSGRRRPDDRARGRRRVPGGVHRPRGGHAHARGPGAGAADRRRGARRRADARARRGARAARPVRTGQPAGVTAGAGRARHRPARAVGRAPRRVHAPSGGARSRCVQFGAGSRLPAEPDEPIDAAVRLEVNRWNGSVEPRLVIKHARPARPAPIEVIGVPEFAPGLIAELDRDLAAWAAAETPAIAARDQRGRGIAGLLADLVATGDPVLAVVAHAPHRARTLKDRIGGFALCSWAALEDAPELAAPYAHVVVVDPPWHPALAGLLEPSSAHLAWGEPELRFAQRIHQWDFALREPLTALYRALRGAGEARGEALEAVLRGEGPQPRSAALAGRLVRVLAELDLVALDREGQALRLTEAPARTALEHSPAFRAYHRRLEDGLRYLTSDTIRQAA